MVETTPQTVHETTRNGRPSFPATIRSIEAVEAAREILSAVPWSRPDPDPDYFLTVVRARPEVIRPHIVRTGDGDEAITFVGRLERITLTTSLGYRALYKPAVRAITLVHGGVDGADDPAAAETLIRSLRTSLSAGEADVVVLPALRVGSALHEAAKATPFALRNHRAARTAHWVLRLPDSYDEFVRSRSKKTREDLSRFRKRLLRDHGESLEISTYRRPDDRQAIFDAVETVAAKTYQRGLGVAFADSADERRLAELDLERGRFRMYVLSIEATPVAFWPGLVHGRTFFIGTPGYDPAFGQYNIGKLLFARVVEDLCADPDVDLVDYGIGDADYKRRFANESWEEEDVVLFARRLRPIWINAAQTTLGIAISGGRFVAEKTGVLQRIKRRWRRRLAARGPS